MDSHHVTPELDSSVVLSGDDSSPRYHRCQAQVAAKSARPAGLVPATGGGGRLLPIRQPAWPPLLVAPAPAARPPRRAHGPLGRRPGLPDGGARLRARGRAPFAWCYWWPTAATPCPNRLRRLRHAQARDDGLAPVAVALAGDWQSRPADRPSRGSHVRSQAAGGFISFPPTRGVFLELKMASGGGGRQLGLRTCSICGIDRDYMGPK